MADRDMAGMAALMGEVVEAMAGAQALGLSLLKAEMEALSQVMPGHPTAHGAEDEARLAAEDAAVEAGFDNLPV